MYLIALYITKGKNCLSTFLFVLTLFLVSRLLSFFKSFFGSKFVFASFGVLGLFKLLLRIQLLDIFVGFWGLNFSSFWVFFFFFSESFFGFKFVFVSFGVLSLFKLLSRIQLLEILLGFRV